MFGKHNGTGYTVALEGIEQKTLVYGERTLMTEFLLKKGSVLSRHAHPHEQTGYLVKGRISLSRSGPRLLTYTWEIFGASQVTSSMGQKFWKTLWQLRYSLLSERNTCLEKGMKVEKCPFP